MCLNGLLGAVGFICFTSLMCKFELIGSIGFICAIGFIGSIDVSIICIGFIGMIDVIGYMVLSLAPRGFHGCCCFIVAICFIGSIRFIGLSCFIDFCLVYLFS